MSRLAEGLDGPSGLARLAQVCDRWVYSACLCFALTQEQQQQSRFSYAYSSYQLEYSRNLLFKSGRQLDEVYQGLIDRTRRLLDVPRLITIFGRKRDRVLRVEVIVNNIEELRCGKRLEKLPGMHERLQRMIVEFLGVVQAAHLSFLDGGQLDALAAPTVRGQKRVAGVDLQKPRMRAVAEAVVALASSPGGFTAKELAARVRAQQGRSMAGIIHPLDAHYQELQHEMLATLQTLKLAA